MAVSACADQGPSVATREDRLAAAGFKMKPANTPKRQASLATLPPHKFVHQVRDGKVIYTYADPTICQCLYVGDQAAYDLYRQNVFQKHLADEQMMSAEMNQAAINSVDWGPWGAMGPWEPGWNY
jgi:hypothetical protein